MVDIMKYNVLRWSALFWLFFVALHAYAHNGQDHQVAGEDAALNAALHWLELSQSADGGVVTPADIATDFQATSEALTVFSILDSSIANRPAALSTLQNAPQTQTTEGLARLIVALSQNLQPVSSQQVELLARQNHDGGFGEFIDYGSTSLDTSLALLALQKINSDTLIASNALAFLSNAQQADGSFPVYGDNGSVIVSAMVLSAIRNYLYTYNISDMLSRAIDYLYAAQNADGSWGSSYWETALVLQSLIPVTTDVSRYQTALDYLTEGQSTEGDWSQQVYTTALAASALQMLSSVDVPVDPEKAVVAGRILDGATVSPINDVAIDVLGVSTETVTLQADGSFVVSNLDPDSYVFAYSAPGYLGASQNITLQRGQFANVGTVSLTIAPTTALIKGVVTHETTGDPIASATVTVIIDGQPVNTTADSTGAYQLLAEAGQALIEVSASGYRTVTATSDLIAGTQVQFSPSLLLTSEEPPAISSLTGTIVDEQEQPVAGATITVAGGSSTISATDGVFVISDLSAGEIQVTVSQSGYSTSVFGVVIPERTNVNVGTITLREQQVLPSTTISGRVIDMVSGQGVPAASVVVGGLSATTDTNGFYRITDIPVLEFTVSVNASGYLFANKEVSLAEHTALTLDVNIRQADLGSVTIGAVTTDKASYGAYDAVVISAAVQNDTALSQGARLYVNVKNASGAEVASFSGAFLPPLDPQSDLEELAHYQQHLAETIEEFAPGEQRIIQLEQWWNTLAVAPGTYTLTVQALDSVTSNLVSERSVLVVVEPTQSISLDIKASPGYVLLNNSADVEIFAEVFNRSNSHLSVTFDYRLLDSDGQVLTEGNSQFDLAPDQINQRVPLTLIPYTFIASGNYPLQVDNVTGTTIEELSEGAVFVPPSIRLRATQSLNPNEVVPLEGVSVDSNIQVEGVDGE